MPSTKEHVLSWKSWERKWRSWRVQRSDGRVPANGFVWCAATARDALYLRRAPFWLGGLSWSHARPAKAQRKHQRTVGPPAGLSPLGGARLGLLHSGPAARGRRGVAVATRTHHNQVAPSLLLHLVPAVARERLRSTEGGTRYLSACAAPARYVVPPSHTHTQTDRAGGHS